MSVMEYVFLFELLYYLHDYTVRKKKQLVGLVDVCCDYPITHADGTHLPSTHILT